MPFFVRPIAKAIANQVLQSFITPNVESTMTFINDHLSRNTWFAGDKMTAADFQMIFPLEAAMSRSEAAKAMPAIAKYVERVHATETYKAALKKGGPYDYAWNSRPDLKAQNAKSQRENTLAFLRP